MPATVVVGLQVDEGKGKTTDLLAEQVSRWCATRGGDNAGHTVVLGRRCSSSTWAPSGVLHPNITPVIGNGVVVNPRTLIAELEMLEGRGSTPRGPGSAATRTSSCPGTSPSTVLPKRALRATRSAPPGAGSVRRMPTARGAPASGDRLDPVGLRAKIDRVLPERNATIEQIVQTAALDADVVHAEAVGWGETLRPMIVDTTNLVQDALAGPARAARRSPGDALDLDHGTYPYVTSSNATGRRLQLEASRAAPGRPGDRRAQGVLDARRLGAVSDRAGRSDRHPSAGEGARVRDRTTRGRRRCGWFDAVPLRYAVAVNSVSSIMLNKLDILSGLDEVRVCTATWSKGGPLAGR